MNQQSTATCTPDRALKAVLLDLDGTLLDTLPDLAAAANAMRRELGMPELAYELIGTFIGKGVDNLVRRTLSGKLAIEVIPEDEFNRARSVFYRHYTELNGQSCTFYPGVLEGIQAFVNMGVRLGVVTNKPTVFTLPLLERTNLAHHMSVVVCGDTCERRKPDPDPFLLACNTLSVSPTAALAIGDSINDALAARAAGCTVLAVPYGYNEGEPVESLPVDGIVESILEASVWASNRFTERLTALDTTEQAPGQPS